MQAEIWAEIRRLNLVEKISKSEIARRLKVSRKTVQKALATEVCPQRIKAATNRPSKLDPFKDYINDRLARYPKLPANVLFKEIKDRGYSGKLRILEAYVRGIKKKSNEAFLRIETLPGEYAQVDWANCGIVQIGNAIRKLSCFVIVLSFSRMMYLEFTLSQCLEDFIQCHINAFKFFGGITRKILYDNLKTVVLSRLGKDIQFNPKFMEFAGVYLFKPKLCNPRRGNEKGKVESGIKYIRSNLLSGIDTRTAWPGIQGKAATWRDETANVRLHRTTREHPMSRFEKEKPFLGKMPANDYDASIIRPVKATSQALVHFDGNTYSVPHTLAGKALTLKASPSTLRLFDNHKQVAEHKRSYERGIVIENPKHYEELLAIKRRARASKIKDAFLNLGELARQYLDGLIESELNLPHHLSQIMDWVRLYGKTEVLQATTRAVDMINHLIASQADHSLHKAMKSYSSPALLIIDEVGYLPFDKQGSDHFFNVISSRYEKGSVILTTNRPFKDWGKIFHDNTVAAAIIDRLAHHSEVIKIEGASYRIKDRKLKDSIKTIK